MLSSTNTYLQLNNTLNNSALKFCVDTCFVFFRQFPK